MRPRHKCQGELELGPADVRPVLRVPPASMRPRHECQGELMQAASGCVYDDVLQ